MYLLVIHHRTNATFLRVLCLLFATANCIGVALGADSLSVYPETIQLGNAAQQHRVLAVATNELGMTKDISRKVHITESESAIVSVLDNTLLPIADGKTTVTVSYNDESVSIPVVVSGVAKKPAASFKLDVMPVFARAGCNTGTCHGASRGQDGFRLSLFGFDPAGDYQRITRELGARRINLALPERSLMLEKATGAVPHTGGKRIDEDSTYYRTLYDWVQEGANPDADTVAEVVGIQLYPPEAVMQGAEGKTAQQQLLLIANYSDQTQRDVTDLAVFLSRDAGVAAVDESGLVTTGRRGESFVTARFEAFTTGVPIAVLPTNSHFEPPSKTPEDGNYIDRLIEQKLNKLHFEATRQCTDEEFLRRISLDVLGQLPTAQEFKTFVANSSTSKRAERIDELLARPEFTDLWANTWADLLLVRANKRQPDVSPKLAFLYFQWLREQLAAGTRFDVIVRQLLTANGEAFESPQVGFYAAENNKLKIAENVAQAFLGIRTQCAQCHNHPFDRWTMDDYYGFAAFFGKVGRKRGEDDREWIIFPGGGRTQHPVTGKPVSPQFLGGDIVEKPPVDPRTLAADWITSPENPYFAKNVANRLWAHFLGSGIVEPVDDVRISNPPANGPLYDELARRLVEYDFDVKRLASDILNSSAYQRTAIHGDGDPALIRNFGQARFRRIPASILLDCIDQVTRTATKHRAVPAGTRAVQLPGEAGDNYFLKTFGRSTRTSVCACESKSEPTLSQALHMINGNSVHGKIQEGKVIQRWLDNGLEPRQVVEALYLRCLSRRPTPAERTKLTESVTAAANPQEGLEDIFWAILNSREFLFNH